MSSLQPEKPDNSSDIEKRSVEPGKMLWSISSSFSLSLFPAADILAEFDDPNIDKDAALAGLLGSKFPSF